MERHHNMLQQAMLLKLDTSSCTTEIEDYQDKVNHAKSVVKTCTDENIQIVKTVLDKIDAFKTPASQAIEQLRQEVNNCGINTADTIFVLCLEKVSTLDITTRLKFLVNCIKLFFS